ncbi:FecR family protein [Arcticibacter tournemirensis]
MKRKYSRAYLSELAHKWKTGTLSQEERKILDEWENSHQDDILNLEGDGDSVSVIKERLLEKLAAEMKKSPAKKPIVRFLPYMAAASVLLVCSLAFYFYSGRSGRNAETASEFLNDVAPGGNKAVLTLADGKKVDLSNVAKGKLAEQAGVRVSKSSDGQLVYEVLGNQTKAGAPLAYNTIATPKGGQFNIKLPDGSSVTLNAASELRFPVSFDALKEREVELKGEAYFEVAKNMRRPFKVSTAGQEVMVLGTQFNINAYADESVTRTTLLEGSVRIAVPGNNITKQLTPGQQAVLAGSVIEVKNGDIESAVAWKNGDFIFDGNIENIMRQISRWYDVEVDFKGDISGEEFIGSVPRSGSLTEVLKALQLTGKVQFKVEGRRVTVMP